MCAAVFNGWDPATTPHPPHFGSYKRVLLVSQDRRHLFVTPLSRTYIQNKSREYQYLIRNIFVLPVYRVAGLWRSSSSRSCTSTFTHVPVMGRHLGHSLCLNHTYGIDLWYVSKSIVSVSGAWLHSLCLEVDTHCMIWIPVGTVDQNMWMPSNPEQCTFSFSHVMSRCYISIIDFF